MPSKSDVTDFVCSFFMSFHMRFLIWYVLIWVFNMFLIWDHFTFVLPDISEMWNRRHNYVENNVQKCIIITTIFVLLNVDKWSSFSPFLWIMELLSLFNLNWNVISVFYHEKEGKTELSFTIIRQQGNLKKPECRLYKRTTISCISWICDSFFQSKPWKMMWCDFNQRFEE